jgi:probable F420-dependent oxidoreductase
MEESMTVRTSESAEAGVDAAGLAPVVDDLGAFVIAGAVSSSQPDQPYATVGRSPAQGVEDGVDAERLGFARIWLSERFDIKNAEAILAGIAARTTRIGIGSGIIVPTSRHPVQLASYAATMHACFGPRLALGLGRGEPNAYEAMGMAYPNYRYMAEYADILRLLWTGEGFAYDGPVGSFPTLIQPNPYKGPRPEVWLGIFGNPRGAEAAAAGGYDGVLLASMLNPDAVRRATSRIRAACERVGRDPASIRICALVTTAPELDEFETRAIAHARAVTYLTWGTRYANVLARANGWDESVIEKLENHARFANLDRKPDFVMHRHDMMEPAKLIPDEWMLDACAIGSIDECVASLQRFRDAGADEIATYGSTPTQNAKLIQAWRRHTASSIT